MTVSYSTFLLRAIFIFGSSCFEPIKTMHAKICRDFMNPYSGSCCAVLNVANISKIWRTLLEGKTLCDVSLALQRASVLRADQLCLRLMQRQLPHLSRP